MSTARKAELSVNRPSESMSFDGIVYGPIESRRLGRSLGLDILGSKAKLCSFDCPYCHLGPTTARLNRLKEVGVLPSTQEIIEQVSLAFQTIHSRGPIVDTICFSGNGEPTLHPEFAEIVNAVIGARNSWLPGKPIALLTNGAALDQRKIADAANKLETRIVKIDAGNEKMFKAINAPLARVNLARILAGTRNLKDFVVQSFFCQGDVDNTKTADVDDWIEVIAILKPIGVQIHGLSRTSAKPGLIRCDEDTLHTIASKLERRTGMKALITP